MVDPIQRAGESYTGSVVGCRHSHRSLVLIRYVALVIVTMSVDELTTTLTVAAVDVRFGATELVAVTEKVRLWPWFQPEPWEL
jgi:hypothetical protein